MRIRAVKSLLAGRLASSRSSPLLTPFPHWISTLGWSQCKVGLINPFPVIVTWHVTWGSTSSHGLGQPGLTGNGCGSEDKWWVWHSVQTALR